MSRRVSSPEPPGSSHGEVQLVFPKELFRSDGLSWRHLELIAEHAPQYIGAEPPGGEGADQDVGVEEDPHETARKTSSSVR